MCRGVVDTDGRRGSPVTLAGWGHRGLVAAEQRAPLPGGSADGRGRRSSRSCATLETAHTGSVSARSSWCSGARACASVRRSRPPSPISTRHADRCLSAAARAASDARSGWTPGAWERVAGTRGSSARAASHRSAVLRHQRTHSGSSVRCRRRTPAAAAAARRRQAGVRRRFAPHQLRHAHAVRWPTRACR